MSTSKICRGSSIAWGSAPIYGSSTPLNEIAYLALECRRLGGPPIERHRLRRYRASTGDTAPRELVCLYAALNALIRARIAICHLAEPGTRTPREWTVRAAAYLAIAAKESRLLSQ